MSKKNKNLPAISERKPLNLNLTKHLLFLKENLRKVYHDEQTYFHENQDQLEVNHYYHSIDLHCNRTELFRKYTYLIEKTHKNSSNSREPEPFH